MMKYHQNISIYLVQIDMSESIESLNASVAAAIAMHQIFIKK